METSHAVASEMNWSFLFDRLQRDKYAKHANKSKKKYLSLTTDGMDQNKTSVPHFSSHSKTTQGMWKLKTKLTGAIQYGKGILGFFDHGQFKVNFTFLPSILAHK